MQKRTRKLIEELSDSLFILEEPINLLAVCTGGITLAKIIHSYLKSKGIKSFYFEVWTNTVHGKRSIWKTNFKKKDYPGSAVIVEDVIWKGASIPPIKNMLKKLNPRKKPYVIALFDCNKKTDFSVFK